MTRSLYIVGGAGTGKSTFMAQLLDRFCMQYTELTDLHARRNAMALVTLRGHRMHDYDGRPGIYLGRLREEFPGTDGLDRASSATGVDWLQNNGSAEFEWLVGEGATLATRPFLGELADRTDLMLVHLYADDFVKELRFKQRGSNQNPRFVEATATRSANLLRDMGSRCSTMTVDTALPSQWGAALEECLRWLS